MSKTSRLEQLEQECKERGVKLIYDDLRSEGGLCRLRGSLYLIMNRRLACETRVRLITEALARAQAVMASRPERGDMTETAEVSDRVPSAPQEVVAETAAVPQPVPDPLANIRPEPVYEEPEFGVPISAGVPGSQG